MSFIFSAIVTLFGFGCGYIKEKAYAGFNRENWQMSENVLATLAIQPGQKIADLGAGAGYFSFKFSEIVKETGMVYAVDIDSDMIHILESKTRTGNVKNIIVVKAMTDNSMLPDKTFDLIFLCNSYHDMYDRIEYFRKLKTKFGKSGKLAVIDLKPQGFYGLFGLHGTSAETISNELLQSGYRLVGNYDYLPKQNFLIFSPEGSL